MSCGNEEITTERVMEEMSRIAFGEVEDVRPADRLRALQALAKLLGSFPDADGSEQGMVNIIDDL